VCVCVYVCVCVFVFIKFLVRKCFSTNNKSFEGALYFFVWLFFLLGRSGSEGLCFLFACKGLFVDIIVR
jgi:hypothetical protein